MVASARIANFLKSHGWAVNLVFIALGSYFVAGALNAVVARAIRVVPSVDDAALVPAFAPPPPAQRAAFGAMAERNLMGLKREQLSPAEAAAAAAPTVLTGRDFKEGDLQPCSLQAIVRATLVFDDNPEWSMAVVVSNATHEPAVYTIAEGQNAIADDAFLVAVRSREIVVRRRDHFERCSGEGDTPGVAPAPYPAVTQVVGDDGPQAPPGDMTGVTKMSDTDYRVERSEIDKVMQNLNEVATQARIVPSFKNGKSNGFKIFSIKQPSIFSKIGMQNGDVIRKINGYDMNSPERALELYTKLRDATSLTIEVQRRGTDMTMNYGITP